VVEVKEILAILEVGARFGQSESADTLVVDGAVGIEATKRNELSLSEQMVL